MLIQFFFLNFWDFFALTQEAHFHSIIRKDQGYLRENIKNESEKYFEFSVTI